MPQASRARKRGNGPRGHQKRPKSAREGRCRLHLGQLRVDPVPDCVGQCLDGRIMTSNSVISPASLNLTRSMPQSCHLPTLAANPRSDRRIPGSPEATRRSSLASVAGEAPARGGDMFLGATLWNGSTMKDDKHKRDGQTGEPAKRNPGRDSRQDRLKLALRENLKRRKSQARGRSDATGASSNHDEVSPHDGGGKKPHP